MAKEQALRQAIADAVAQLATVNWTSRCPRLGLGEPTGGTLALRMFGGNYRLTLDDLSLTNRDNGKEAKPADQLLLLHYLACESALSPGQELISFRTFCGGEFYYQPFCSRTREPLLKRFGNDVDGLRASLDHFDWEPVATGDLGARIHALGVLSVTLVYRQGDEEFPASADVLFDAVTPRAFGAEDAAVMASRVCIGLLN